MQRTFNLSILNLIIVAALLQATPALAAPPACPALGNPPSFAEVLRRVACKAGFITAADTQPVTDANVVTAIGLFISAALSFVGVIFVIIVLYGGWLWGTAGGNEERVAEGQKFIRNATIGIIVVFAAFTISRAVLLAINEAIIG